MAQHWVDVAAAADLQFEDVIPVRAAGVSLAVYRAKSGAYFASDAICTHEFAHLAEGFVFDFVVECPKHQGRFDIRTGACKGAPVSVPLRTYPVRVVDGRIEVDIAGG